MLTSFLYSFVVANPKIDPKTLAIDGRYTHTQQIQERLDFLRFTIFLKFDSMIVCVIAYKGEQMKEKKERMKELAK